MAKKAAKYRGQLMLQIAHGKYFRPGVPLNETPQRRTFYTNVGFAAYAPVELPVGRITGSTVHGEVNSVFIEAVDRLEAKRPDGTDDFMVATGGDDLVGDVAYVSTFVLNRTFSADHDLVRRLISPPNPRGLTRPASTFFPDLFDPDAVISAASWDHLRTFMTTLIGLGHEPFATAMRAIRRSVDATRRAIDDPTGAYVDLVAALESLADLQTSSPTVWERYDGRKRNILEPALAELTDDDADRVKKALLEADRADLKRKFVSSTLTRIAPTYFREGAHGVDSPPRAPDVERMLSLAYEIRSRRSHILEDLSDEAWRFNDGAETAYVAPARSHLLTHAGLWRLLRHVLLEFVHDSQQVPAAAWDYRDALPGIATMELAPQYWISGTGITAAEALNRLGGVVAAYIEVASGRTDQGFNLTDVATEIEALVPTLEDSDGRTALVAIHLLWHTWIPASEVGETAKDFATEYEHLLKAPSMTSFVASVLAGWVYPWAPDQWRDLARTRRAEREESKSSRLPASFDALLQLAAADNLEEAGRHGEALEYAAYAVEEMPGHKDLIEWERRLVSGDHDPNFSGKPFILGLDAAQTEQLGNEDKTGHTESADEPS